MGKPVTAAPQPEAPTLADDLVARCNAEAERLWRGFGKFKGPTAGDIRAHDILREAAARIESDAERIRELEADNAGIAEHCGELIDRATKAEELLAASRERERAEKERGDELWQRCETLALLVEKYVQCYTRQWNPLNGIAEANTDLAIAKRLATPDSAASPTGGEG